MGQVKLDLVDALQGSCEHDRVGLLCRGFDCSCLGGVDGYVMT